MNSKAFQHVSQLSIGEVKTELKPVGDYKEQDQNQRQVLDAMSSTAHTTLMAWVIDNATDPSSKGGSQERITTTIEDNGRKVAELILSVPTTQNYPKALFEGFVEQGLVPAVQQAFRSYPSTRSEREDALSPLSRQTFPDALDQASRISPKELRRQTR